MHCRQDVEGSEEGDGVLPIKDELWDVNVIKNQ
jgi:hypothetical protein